MSVSMNEALSSFIRYIENEKMYSEYTISNYQKDVLEFEEFLKKESFGSLLKSINNAGRYYTAYLNEHYHKLTTPGVALVNSGGVVNVLRGNVIISKSDAKGNQIDLSDADVISLLDYCTKRIESGILPLFADKVWY